MSFQQGLSGLNGAQKSLDAISNNVANSNTAGFKASQAQFSDVYAISLAGGGSGSQTGIGVNVAAVSQQFSQGNITVTNNPLDLAINGAGFYRMSNAGNVTYTRNGQFTLDKDGYIVNPAGYRLTGYGAGPTGGVVNGVFTDLRVQASQGTPKATEKVEMTLNLDARADPIDGTVTPFDTNNPLSYTSGTSLNVFDTQGFPHTLSLFVAKRSPNTWEMYQSLDLGAPASTTTLTFNPDGQLASPTMPLNPATTFPVATGGDPITASLNLNLTQFGTAFGVGSLSQDGFTVGQVSGVAVGQDGLLQVRYSNGQAVTLGQVVLGSFANPNGLLSVGGNQWVETPDSGQPAHNYPGKNGMGVLQSAAIEESNVDLTRELVDMITQQRNYQANAQSIKTQDQLLQTLVNLR